MEEEINIIYGRISKKEEGQQDLEHQIEKLIEKFNPNKPIILKEKGSAYDLENIKNRTEFIKILNLAYENKGITDIFLQDFTKKNINIYIWDLNRIMRNVKFNLLFSLLASIHNVTIYSYQDNEIKKKRTEEDYDEEFITLLLNVLAAKKAEDYSRDISKNTKKAFTREKNSSYSRKGNKVGKKFKDSEGDPVTLTAEEENRMYDYVVSRIVYYKLKKINCFYPMIIKELKERFNIVVSTAYISKIKKGIEHE